MAVLGKVRVAFPPLALPTINNAYGTMGEILRN